ncbi:hypothetical protein J2X69_001154 [Algoriphagus sp. 4150]|uniref:hypothetical protein n=1 Tax=Algoriphagus sp. 4150 TaxID=2817756 RepID=UPI00285583D9|nr:hypothetical protein [Algoriphagus sp. 4150]MDR7128822.1 hypothetical protein [Algoriphagus sp. 4150]
MEEKKINKLVANILKAKGLSEEQLEKLEEVGIYNREDFEIVSDAATLSEILSLETEVSKKIMEWALGRSLTFQSPSQSTPTIQESSGPIIVESSDVVKCVHCGTRQPKDYKTGDLCLSCGNQAEPVLNCHWCLSTGPGKFCRSCGSEFVTSSDYEIALLLKREGESKNNIVSMIKSLTAQEKENMWAKIRKSR